MSLCLGFAVVCVCVSSLCVSCGRAAAGKEAGDTGRDVLVLSLCFVYIYIYLVSLLRVYIYIYMCVLSCLCFWCCHYLVSFQEGHVPLPCLGVIASVMVCCCSCLLLGNELQSSSQGGLSISSPVGWE